MENQAAGRNYEAGVLTVSDRSARGEREDLSGPALAAALEQDGYRVARLEVVPDDTAAIEWVLKNWCDHLRLALVLTTGGTGPGPRDITPEATRAILEREMPGLPAAILHHSLAVTPHAMLSRGCAGIRGQTLVVNLPGSLRGALECLRIIAAALPHALEVIRGKGEEGHAYKGSAAGKVE